ncbi:MAG: ATP-binding protein [Ignavibacteria bacterium]|nr:ATP-binding protein [Ignavibacteria bacterium]
MDISIEKLRELDNILLNIKDCVERQNQKYRNDYTNTVCKTLKLRCEKIPEKTLFNPNQSGLQKKFITICLIRLLCYKPIAVWDWEPLENRINTFKLFKEYASEFFKECKIKVTDDNHIIQQGLQDLENNIIERFDTIKQKIINPKAAYEIRNEFMRYINIYKPYLNYFIDGVLVNEERLKEVFEAIENYKDSDVTNLLINYKKVEEVLNNFIFSAKKYNLILNYKCIVQIFENIKLVIEKDFGKSEYLKLATIKLDYLDRKYPFHEKDKKINIKFILQNLGPGYAFDVKISIDCDDILISNSEILLGTINPQKKIVITLEAEIIDPIPNKTPSLLVRIEWSNHEGLSKSREEILELKPQRKNLDWESLKSFQPYSLEAIEMEDEFVGRNEIIHRIQNKLSANKIESVIIHGQKRVGKTSIANIIKTKLNQLENYVVISLNVGDLNKINPEKFVNDLGNYIFEELKDSKKVRPRLYKPKFEGAISPLLHVFRDIHKSDLNIRFIIIIDEFDEIPSELYKFSDIGNTFFHNMRSLSKENFIGFVLVGSENIEIIKQSTEMINKFENFRVDYFDKENYWNDFKDLVKRPLNEYIEYEDVAILRLFNITEGNPFYTNLICSKVYDQVIENRNAFITEDDVDKGIHASIKSLETNEINHFWKDCNVTSEAANKDLIETNRRKFLVGFACIEREKGIVTKEYLVDEHKFKNSIPINELLESFKNRGIIISENDILRIKPNLIGGWLKEKGIDSITTGFLDDEAITILKEKEHQAFVTDEEVVKIAEKWGIYNGHQLSPIEVRAWLNQFENNQEKRLMFRILSELKFYSEQEVREKLRILHEQIKINIKTYRKDKEINIREILLTNMANIAKSGYVYLRKYAQENKILQENIVHFSKITETLESNSRIQLILIIDDIIGTGRTQIELTSKYLNEEILGIIKSRNIKLIYASICGTNKGIKTIQEFLNKYPIETEVKCLESLTKENKCFDSESIFFDNEIDRENARKVALKYGNQIDRKQPLGFEDSELAIVFFDNCPNNTLPIIWKRNEKNPKWFPLFERKHIF